MHRMDNREVIIDDNSDCGVGAKVVDVPLWIKWVGVVALVREKQNRVAIQ